MITEVRGFSFWVVRLLLVLRLVCECRYFTCGCCCPCVEMCPSTPRRASVCRRACISTAHRLHIDTLNCIRVCSTAITLTSCTHHLRLFFLCSAHHRRTRKPVSRAFMQGNDNNNRRKTIRRMLCSSLCTTASDRRQMQTARW